MLFFRRKKEKFITEKNFELIIDSLKYEIFDELSNLKIPKIKTVKETIDMLQNSNCSFCRFGDGELDLIDGRDIPFQKSSELLSSRLKEVLSSSSDNLRIAIPRIVYGSKDGVSEHSKKFWRVHGKKFRDRIKKHISIDQEYYSAEVTLLYSLYDSYDFDGYFNQLRKIWNEKEIVIVCGSTVFDQIEFNIFDNAKSIEKIDIPNKDAFDDYDSILGKCSVVNKDKLFVAIAGPTAKILSYDLAQKGYRILDLGHIAKAYDWFKKKKEAISTENMINFFSPD